ncbi:hypothetical protein BGZ59_003152, partial [Podila verticillata]
QLVPPPSTSTTNSLHSTLISCPTISTTHGLMRQIHPLTPCPTSITQSGWSTTLLPSPTSMQPRTCQLQPRPWIENWLPSKESSPTSLDLWTPTPMKLSNAKDSTMRKASTGSKWQPTSASCLAISQLRSLQLANDTFSRPSTSTFWLNQNPNPSSPLKKQPQH